MAHWDQQLEAIKQQHSYRVRRCMSGPQASQVTLDGNTYHNFCSNDYLGLAHHAKVRKAAKQAIDEFGCGSGASQHINGYSRVHAECEQQLADFLQVEKVVLFGSGYLANLGVLSSLSKRHDCIFGDKLNHASLIDAAQSSTADFKRYRHADTDHLGNLLTECHYQQGLVVTDGVFSMQGSSAPMSALIQQCRKHDAMLIVDDAHGIGVLGEHGRGSLEAQNIASHQVDVLIGTFGKSFGSGGAFVAGETALIEYLIQKARSMIYTTALAPSLAAAATASLQIICAEPERRMRLHENIQYFKQAIANSPLNLQPSDSAIQSIILGSNEKTLAASQALETQGCLVVAIRPPTVPKNTARLRITLSSEHQVHQIDHLVSVLMDIDHAF
jgi:8-amino-7-oxononanoate synthase